MSEPTAPTRVSRRLVIGGVALVTLVVGVTTALLLASPGHEDPGARLVAVAEPVASQEADTSFGSLGPGDCIADLDGVYVHAVARVDCGLPHRLEVFHLFEVPDQATYPGDWAVEEAAYQGCAEQYEIFIGRPYFDPEDTSDKTSRVDIGHATPTRHTWESEGDREVICWIFFRDERWVTGSLTDVGKAD